VVAVSLLLLDLAHCAVLSLRKRRRRKLFETTKRLEKAIAAAAIIGSAAGGRQADRGDVVGERPEQIALDRGERPPRQHGSRRPRRVDPQRTSVRSDASIANIGPGAIASPRSAWASAGASFTPSPTIALPHPAAAGAAPRRPCRPDIPPRDPLDPHLACDPVRLPGARRRSAGWREAELLQLRDRLRVVGLTVSRTTSCPLSTPSQLTTIAPLPRPTRTACPSTSPTTPTPGRWRSSRRPAANQVRRGGPRLSERSDAPRPARLRRQAGAHRHARRRSGARCRELHAALGHGAGLSSTIVVIRLVCSRICGPLIKIRVVRPGRCRPSGRLALRVRVRTGRR